MSKWLDQSTALLILSDGKIFSGYGVGAYGIRCGEICFNTSVTGYQEIITDPSYSGQIIAFTFPHIGNVGVNHEDVESRKLFLKGIIIRENITSASNWRSQSSLDNWLKTNNIVGISGIDTRSLTKHIRKHGAQNALIYHASSINELNIDELKSILNAAPNLNGIELAEEVSCKESYTWDEPTWENSEQYHKKYKIVAIDYGVKSNILRSLVSLGGDVTVVPATSNFEEIIKHKPDGIFLSNGPGDPAATSKYTKSVIQKIIAQNIPTFGICLGHQLIALAIGGETKKMHQGHRGANHPVTNLETGMVEITSQNHGFEVKRESLPINAKVTHISLFDGSIEGIELTDKPVFSVQYHPESSPGPHDSHYLFKKFIKMIENHKNYTK